MVQLDYLGPGEFSTFSDNKRLDNDWELDN